MLSYYHHLSEYYETANIDFSLFLVQESHEPCL